MNRKLSSISPQQLVLAVMISGRGSNLAAIIEAGIPVTAVVSSRAAAGGLDIARAGKITSAAIERKAFADRQGWEDAMAGFIEAAGCNVVALAGFMHILSAGFIDRFGGRIVNLHPSLLPDFKGLDTHARAIAAGKSEHGCTAHWIIPELDEGPIIRQERVSIQPEDTPESLGQRVRVAEHSMYPQVIADILAGRIRLPE